MRIRQFDYAEFADLYDLIELSGKSETPKLNQFLDILFKKRGARRILDIACGTGAQAIGIAKLGYDVTASDCSIQMLRIARKKGRGLRLRFRRGDMRAVHPGKFDAIISMFNAIGHLSLPGFKKAISCVAQNLRQTGCYVFDIFNLDFMRSGGFRDYEYIDAVQQWEGTTYIRFSRNKLDKQRGIIHINNRLFIQKGMAKPRILNQSWDMKIYTANELAALLRASGFSKIGFYDGPMAKFDPKKSLSILTVAEK